MTRTMVIPIKLRFAFWVLRWGRCFIILLFEVDGAFMSLMSDLGVRLFILCGSFPSPCSCYLFLPNIDKDPNACMLKAVVVDPIPMVRSFVSIFKPTCFASP